MVVINTKKINLSAEDLKRQKNIISKLNLKKLPFSITTDKMIFSFGGGNPSVEFEWRLISMMLNLESVVIL